MLVKTIGSFLEASELGDQLEIIKSYPLNGYLINCTIQGELNGNLAFVMNSDETFRMIEILTMAEKGSVTVLDDMGKSALNELINVLSGAYLTSLSDFCDFNLMPNPPIFFSNYRKEDLVKIFGTDKKILEIKTSFNILKENIYSRMWLVLEKSGMEQILKKLE